MDGLGRRPDGENRDERRGAAPSGSTGAGEKQNAEGDGCGEPGGSELPAGEAVVETVSGARACGAEARRSGAPLESRARGEVSTARVAARAGQVQRSGGGAVWTDAGGRALAIRGRAEDRRRNAAALDAGGRVVESGAETAAAPLAAGAQRTFRRDGADGRQLPRVAGGALTAGLLDRYGGRRHQHDVGATGRARDDLGGGRCAARLDRAERSAQVVVCGLEKSVQASGHGEGAVAGRG